MSGLSLVVMMERELSFRNCVAGPAPSSGGASGSRSTERRSNRLVGWASVPRPNFDTGGFGTYAASTFKVAIRDLRKKWEVASMPEFYTYV
jgi:hypothetical protein